MSIGVDVPRSAYAATVDDAEQFALRIGYPLVIALVHPRRIGRRHRVQRRRAALDRHPRTGALARSPRPRRGVGDRLEEFELEVMRDRADNVIIVCSIENFDPMGVHTGDSITVAPQQTLTNDEYQAMRDEAKRIIRAIGVETGGSNIQFAVHPKTSRRICIEMNPRVALVRARVEGDRLPYREVRGEARRRLHARRDPERHHEEDAGVVRAIHRLRGREDPALLVREVPEHAAAPQLLDAVRRRVDGDRPHVQRGAAEGIALARDRRRGTRNAWAHARELPELLRVPTPERIFAVGDALRAGCRSRKSTRCRTSIRGFCARSASSSSWSRLSS